MKVTIWLKWVMEPSYEPRASIDCGHRKRERSLCWRGWTLSDIPGALAPYSDC